MLKTPNTDRNIAGLARAAAKLARKERESLRYAAHVAAYWLERGKAEVAREMTRAA